MHASNGSLIKQARQKKGLTQKQLSHELGLSERQVKNIENGVSEAHVDHLRRAAAVLNVPLTYFGLADDRALSVGADDLLPMLWSLFYSGQYAPAQPYIPVLAAWLQRQTSTLTAHAATLSRAWQFLSTAAHDAGDRATALQALDRATDLARHSRDPNDLAAALFRRARLHAALPLSDLPRAVADSSAAVALAHQCRPILASVIHVYQARIMAAAGRPMQDIDIALGLIGTTYGQDASGTMLDAAAVLHTRAHVLLLRAGGDTGMLWDAADSASAALGQTHALRHQTDIRCTLAAILLARADADGALDHLLTIATAQPSPKLRARATALAQRLPASPDQRALLRQLVARP